jgi:lysozyme
MSNFIKGIDASALQGVIDWSSVATAGYQFVILRAGVGNSGIDTYYPANVAKANAAGLKVAAYNFVFPLPPLASQPLRDPVKQAQFHFQGVKNLVSVVCCDWEWPVPADWKKWGVNAQFIIDWTLTYLQEYERLSGQKPVIYTYPDFANHLNPPAQFAQYKLWIASYETNPTIPHPWQDYVLWQNSDHGHLPNGVEVDTDLAKDLSLWDTIPASAPVVEPLPQHQPDPPIVDTAPVSTPVVAPVQPSPQRSIFVYIWNALINFFTPLK